MLIRDQKRVLMDKVVQAVEELKKEWEETLAQALAHVKSIEDYRRAEKGLEEGNSLQRLNAIVQDELALLRSMQFRLDLLAPQMPTDAKLQSALSMLELWKEQYQSLHLGLRNANLQAKANIRKAAQVERELLLGGGGESTIRRHKSQTKAGLTSAAESITDSLRHTRLLMVQEVQRSSTMLTTSEESIGVLKKAESEYRGHRSLLMKTRDLLSTISRQDVLDKLIVSTGFIFFSCVVLYVVSKRIGLLKLQRKVTAAVKKGQIEIRHGDMEDNMPDEL